MGQPRGTILTAMYTNAYIDGTRVLHFRYLTTRISRATRTLTKSLSSGKLASTHTPPFQPVHLLRRWKQRDIHEKREMRKIHIAQLKADIACNEVLQPRLVQIASSVAANGPSEFSSLVERFKTNPSPERPPTNAPEQKTYDEMLLSLMLSVWEKAKEGGVEKDDPRLGEKLAEGLRGHVEQMKEHQEKLKKELEQEEAEQKKKITSDDIHEGFESKVSRIISLRRYMVLKAVCTISTSLLNQNPHRSRTPSPQARPHPPNQQRRRPNSKSSTPKASPPPPPPPTMTTTPPPNSPN